MGAGKNNGHFGRNNGGNKNANRGYGRRKKRGTNTGHKINTSQNPHQPHHPSPRDLLMSATMFAPKIKQMNHTGGIQSNLVTQLENMDQKLVKAALIEQQKQQKNTAFQLIQDLIESSEKDLLPIRVLECLVALAHGEEEEGLINALGAEQIYTYRNGIKVRLFNYDSPEVVVQAMYIQAIIVEMALNKIIELSPRDAIQGAITRFLSKINGSDDDSIETLLFNVTADFYYCTLDCNALMLVEFFKAFPGSVADHPYLQRLLVFSQFIFKVISNNDISCFWPHFVDGLAHGKKHVLRDSKIDIAQPSLRRAYTVRLAYNKETAEGKEGEIDSNQNRSYEVVPNDKALKPSLFGKLKEGFTTHQSVTYASYYYLSAPFGDTYRPKPWRMEQIGICFDLKDVLIQRIWSHDSASTMRPYDFDEAFRANRYIIHETRNHFLFTSLESLEQYALERYRDLDDKRSLQKYNEVQARLRPSPDGSMKIVIFADALKDRLFAQLRAIDLAANLKIKALRNATDRDEEEINHLDGENIIIPIMFYPTLRDYSQQEQLLDLGIAAEERNDPTTNLYASAITHYHTDFQELSLPQLQPLISVMTKLSLPFQDRIIRRYMSDKNSMRLLSKRVYQDEEGYSGFLNLSQSQDLNTIVTCIKRDFREYYDHLLSHYAPFAYPKR